MYIKKFARFKTRKFSSFFFLIRKVLKSTKFEFFLNILKSALIAMTKIVHYKSRLTRLCRSRAALVFLQILLSAFCSFLLKVFSFFSPPSILFSCLLVRFEWLSRSNIFQICAWHSRLLFQKLFLMAQKITQT
jgi:hypothetical protein